VDNRPQGRSIRIYSNGIICIGYFHNGKLVPGNYLYIDDCGSVVVGECHLKNGKSWERGTKYFANGTKEKFDIAY